MNSSPLQMAPRHLAAGTSGEDFSVLVGTQQSSDSEKRSLQSELAEAWKACDGGRRCQLERPATFDLGLFGQAMHPVAGGRFQQVDSWISLQGVSTFKGGKGVDDDAMELERQPISRSEALPGWRTGCMQQEEKSFCIVEDSHNRIPRKLATPLRAFLSSS